jgi:eukaryotic-like serine/threonine-protein kinase
VDYDSTFPEVSLSTIFGRYQVLEKIGQGGMGVVYRAHDTLLERIVALKVIATTINDNPHLRERFFREARAAGQLSHRNIITIHDLGEHEGQPYLAMEFLTGEDLQHRLTHPEVMSLGRKLEIAADVCEGLSYAHRRGVIHRDIKPANIFITDDGIVKILDFGLARMVASEVTASNMMLGTLNYMAPEQVRGERTDHRADIFSFGVVFYEILSGKKAFQGDSYATTLYKILQDVPEPLHNIDATLPPEVVRIVEKALAKPRDERYQDLTDVARDIAIVRQHLSTSDAVTTAMPASNTQRVPSESARSTAATPRMIAPTDTTAAHTVAPLPEPLPAPRRAGRSWMLPATVVVIVTAISVAGWVAYRGSEGTPKAPTVQVPAPPAASPGSSQALPPPPGSATPSEPPAPVTPATQPQPQPSPAESPSIARRTADAARAEMIRTKNAARKAGPAAVTSAPYVAATAAEREGTRLFEAERFAEAAATFYQASGLFHSAALTATIPPAQPQRAEQEPPPPSASAAPPGSAAPGTPVETPAQPPAAPAPTPAPAPAPVPSTPRSEPAPPPSSSQPPAQPPRAETPPTPSAEDGVRDLLRRYEQALESRSIDALKRLWPTLGGSQEGAIRREFDHARQIDVSIEGPDITVSGATATIRFIRKYQLSTVDGQKLVTNSRTTVSARRAGNEWVLDQVRFEALR